MSKAKSKKPIPKREEELEDEEYEEDELDEIDELEFVQAERKPQPGEDYDPNSIFEAENKNKKLLDLSKLPKEQRDIYLRNYKRLVFLKALAKDVYQDVAKLAIEKCKMSEKAEGEKCITTMIGMIGHTSKEVDFPATVLKYFNGLLPDNYPNKPNLDEDDINELTNLFKVVEEKLLNEAKITDADRIWGKDVQLDAKTINESNVQKKVLMDSNQEQQPSIPIDNGQLYPNQPKNTKEYYIGKYDIPDIGLMEMTLRSIPNPRPNSIQNFIDTFTDLYTDWMQNPMKMIEQLRCNRFQS